jgi:hypothetical protein
MSATTVTGSVRSERSWKQSASQAKRTVLVAAAIVVLIAVSFFIGRVTSSSATAPHAASIVPATALIARECAQNGQANAGPSHAGRAC